MSGFKVTIAILILSLPLAAFAVPDDQNDLLKARELVWRAWFAGYTKTLKDLLPPETIAISGGNKHWDTQPEVIKSAADFRAQGGSPRKKANEAQPPANECSTLKRDQAKANKANPSWSPRKSRMKPQTACMTV